MLSIPEMLYLPAGETVRLPLSVTESLRFSDVPVLYSVDDNKKRCVIHEHELLLGCVDRGVVPELVLSLPPYAFRGIMTVKYGEATANCAVSCVDLR